MSKTVYFVAFCGKEFVTLPVAFLYFLEHSRIEVESSILESTCDLHQRVLRLI